MNISQPQTPREPPSDGAVDSFLHDPSRLAAVRDSGLLDSPPEEAFDALTRLASRLLKVPASFVSVIDAGRDFYKSHSGFPEALAQARELEGRTFCHYTLDSEMPLVIEDTHAHPAWKAVPTVESLGVRAYMGIPLKLDGQIVASFCVIDAKPRSWTAEELEILRQLATSAGRELNLRAALKTARMELLSAQALARSREELVAAMQVSEGQFRTLTQAMPQMVFATDTSGNNTYVNQQWVDYTGLGQDETMRWGLAAPIHPDDREPLQQAWDDAQDQHSSYLTECRIRRLDGEYRWWLVRSVCVFDPAGLPTKWIGTCTDIHELKIAVSEVHHANLQLQRQKVEIRVLFDLVPAMIWFKDTDNNILRINQRAAESLGKTVAQVEGLPISDFYPSDAEEFHAGDLEVIRTGRPIMGKIERHTDAHGSEFWLQKDKVPYRDEDGNVIGIVVMSFDISERKRDQDALHELNSQLESRVIERTSELNLARQDAEHANEAKSEFLAAMSHEIRTPMNGLFGLLELLGQSGLNPEQRYTLTAARASGDALLKIMDDILDFTKIEAHRVELHAAPASVRDVVNSSCRLYEPVAADKKLAFQCHVAPEVSPGLLLDALRLGQIINNFLSNAIKFTQHGEVELRLEVAGDVQGRQQLRFIVRDTGIGISAEQLGRLFNPFVQASADTSSRFGGTGLGLSIARRLVELMGGTVAVESTPGRGTSMTVLVEFDVCPPDVATQAELPPALESAPHFQRPPLPTVEEARASGMLILVVDDHPANRMVLVRQLASLGYASETAVDGVEALQACERGSYGAIVTDCNMPRMDGYVLAAAVRKIEHDLYRPRIPILACTANALPSAVEACLNAGMDDCLVKPVTLAGLGALMDRWLPHRTLAGLTKPTPAAANLEATVPSALDPNVLAEISGGSTQIQSEILAEYLRANALDVPALRRAVEAARLDEVRGFAHRIKGSSAMVGAPCLADACSHLEEAAAAIDITAVGTSMDLFDSELKRVEAYIGGLAQQAQLQTAAPSPE